VVRTLGVHIDEVFCQGCGICVAVCNRGVLEISSELSRRGVYAPRVVALERCTACRLCELHCPDFAIAIERALEQTHA
jgi:2-oxoglutarate ferredoxin oxidoreductase subunit delta